MKRVHIKTYGCQMNVYDSQRMADALAEAGYAETGEVAEADLVLLNTCHIREKAAEKVYSEIGRLRQLRADRRTRGEEMMIGVTGCVAQAEGDEILRRAPSVDLVVGPQSYHRLPGLVAAASRGKIVDTDFPEEDKFRFLPGPRRAATIARGLTAFLTVQEGCDKFCAFCVVPYTRGAEASRPAGDIMAEARQLVAAGVREITLLGQNVNAYHGLDGDGVEIGLGGLIDQLAGIKGLWRLRYTTSHPNDMDEGLIAAHGALDKLMPYLHLPVQSGSDAVLKAMNRRHSASDYLTLVGRIRAARPDIALSGDFIVGFPGETDADFEKTLELVSEVRYAAAFSFKYSPRPGTPAATSADQVPEEVKRERLARLQTLISEGQGKFNQACVGRRMEVLVDKKGRNAGQMAGRSPYLQAVHFDGPERLVGTLCEVEIIGCGKNSLEGRIVTDSARETVNVRKEPAGASRDGMANVGVALAGSSAD